MVSNDWLKHWDFGQEEEEADYMTVLMNRVLFNTASNDAQEEEGKDEKRHSKGTRSKQKDGKDPGTGAGYELLSEKQGMLSLKGRDLQIYNETHRLKSFKIHQSSEVVTHFREYFGFCYEADSALLHVLYSYRKQMLENKLYNLSLLDEEELASASTIEELASYQGLIHVRDLAMMLGDLLHYYRPFGFPLSTSARRYIIMQYDKWVVKNCVETIAFAKNLHFDADNGELEFNTDILNPEIANKGKQAVKTGFFTPCAFSYRAVHDFSLLADIKSEFRSDFVEEKDGFDELMGANKLPKKHNSAFREETVLFTDICVICMDEDAVEDEKESENKKFILATPAELAVADSNAPKKLVASASVPFDKFGAWFIKLDEKLLPRIEAELRVEESKQNEELDEGSGALTAVAAVKEKVKEKKNKERDNEMEREKDKEKSKGKEKGKDGDKDKDKAKKKQTTKDAQSKLKA